MKRHRTWLENGTQCATLRPLPRRATTSRICLADSSGRLLAYNMRNRMIPMTARSGTQSVKYYKWYMQLLGVVHCCHWGWTTPPLITLFVPNILYMVWAARHSSRVATFMAAICNFCPYQCLFFPLGWESTLCTFVLHCDAAILNMQPVLVKIEEHSAWTFWTFSNVIGCSQ